MKYREFLRAVGFLIASLIGALSATVPSSAGASPPRAGSPHIAAATLKGDESKFSNPPDTLHYGVQFGVRTFLSAWTEYNPSTCQDIDQGAWTDVTLPKHGDYSTDTIMSTLNNGDCPGVQFPFAAIYYTWSKDKQATKDKFSATWNSIDYSEPETFTFDLGSALKITKPKDSFVASLTDADFRSVKVPYEATANGASDTVSWTVGISYTTNGGVGTTPGSDSFSSPTDTATQRPYMSEGGQITVNATGAASGNAPQIQYYIAGSPIPNSEITSQLETLYQKTGLPTATLLAQIAVIESTYKQFGTTEDYGMQGHWPTESDGDNGGHIGLMQVETTMVRAFDWHVNSQDGYKTFADKIGAVNRYMTKTQKAMPGLPNLSGVQIEDSALSYYRGFKFHYYQAEEVGGVPTWVMNPKDTTIVRDHDTAAGYVAKVRAAQIPN